VGGLLIVLGFEFWFFITEYIDRELNLFEVVILEGIVLFAFFWNLNTLFGYFNYRLALPLAALAPAIYAIMKGTEKLLERKTWSDYRNKEIGRMQQAIQKDPNNISAYIVLGDIYFKRGNYETALSYFRQASTIQDFPWLTEKIKVTEKEDKIQKSEIWICRECSTDNPAEFDTCGNCKRPRPTFKEDFAGQRKEIKEEIKKGIFLIIILPPAILLPLILIVWLIIILPWYFSVIIVLCLLYLVFRIFNILMDD